MTYGEAIDFLQGLQRFGMRPGLDATRRLATLAGNPERGMRFIHVAGTNGKGSTCAFLESIYRAHGLRVGMYTSPHLISFRERMQMNRVQIREVDVARLVQRLRTVLAGLEAEHHPTFFEFVTVMALCWFREQECDLVVWETGLGGRLDATNIVTPLASIITNIGWDHMAWLGTTLSAIAAEKAGIIKPGVPVFTATVEGDALEVLKKAAERVRAPLRRIDAGSEVVGFARSAHLPLAGEHQVANAALAVATVRELDSIVPINGATLLRALQQTHWPGRFQSFTRDGKTIIVDGAHNRPAFEVLAATLDQMHPGVKPALVLGMLGDKDHGAARQWLVPRASRVVVVPVHSARAGDPAGLAELCRSAAGEVPVVQAESMKAALALLAEEPLVLVTGSLYLAGEALEAMEGGTHSERELNDWSRTR